MEDDRIESNNESERIIGKNTKSFIFAFFIIIISVIAFSFSFNDVSKNVSINETDAKPPIKEESKDDYIKSSSRIGGKKASIYYKEYLKNPTKYDGHRINVNGKVLQIHESNNETSIQLIINDKYDSVMAHYPGSIKVYQDDFVTIYGEGAGTIDGVNRMGAAMSWPVIKAKYVVKRVSSDE